MSSSTDRTVSIDWQAAREFAQQYNWVVLEGDRGEDLAGVVERSAAIAAFF
jgi:hypothetical protein